MVIKETSEIDEELDEKLDKSLCRVIDVVEEIAKKTEEKFGATRGWRGFRMDELLLSSIRLMIYTHLHTVPPYGTPDPTRNGKEIKFDPQDERKLSEALNSMFIKLGEVASTVAKKNKLPGDVTFVRQMLNLIMNLIGRYTQFKQDYAKKYAH